MVRYSNGTTKDFSSHKILPEGDELEKISNGPILILVVRHL